MVSVYKREVLETAFKRLISKKDLRGRRIMIKVEDGVTVTCLRGSKPHVADDFVGPFAP
jgi:hypothetical protein